MKNLLLIGFLLTAFSAWSIKEKSTEKSSTNSGPEKSTSSQTDSELEKQKQEAPLEMEDTRSLFGGSLGGANTEENTPNSGDGSTTAGQGSYE